MQIFAHVDVLTQTRLEIKCAAEKDFYDSFISLKEASQFNQITHVLSIFSRAVNALFNLAIVIVFCGYRLRRLAWPVCQIHGLCDNTSRGWDLK